MAQKNGNGPDRNPIANVLAENERKIQMLEDATLSELENLIYSVWKITKFNI